MAALVSGATPPVAQTLLALAALLQAKQWFMCSAESCTGGLIAAACTDLSGASAWFERGFVTYSNRAKTECLGVPQTLLQAHGAVSQAVVLAMAAGAAKAAGCSVAVATSGVAGPSGGSADKPVGTVWFGFWAAGHGYASQAHFAGSRAQIRAQSTDFALAQLLLFLQGL